MFTVVSPMSDGMPESGVLLVALELYPCLQGVSGQVLFRLCVT